ncbi:MAG: DUF2336 domain-containing protein [Beijerinckiaceae bacterium]
MIIKSYLEWSQTASAEDRALAVGILAEVYLGGELGVEERWNAEAALTLALDDSSVGVRKRLAELLGSAERVPRHIIQVLAQDTPEVSRIVLANSPVLRDVDLIEQLSRGSESLNLAVAQRAHVSIALAASIMERCDITAILALLENEGAEVPEASLPHLLERFADEGSLREVLLARDDLPVSIRVTLVAAIARQLTGFAESCGWLTTTRADRLARETREAGAITVASSAQSHEISEAVIRLRKSGQLTPQLLLRSVLSGETRLLVAALADLAEVSLHKASGFVHSRSGMGFKALYRKAGMPAGLLPAFEAALSAWHEFGAAFDDDAPRLSLRMVERVLTSVAMLEREELGQVMLLLTQYQSEAAREEARISLAALMSKPAPPVMIEQDDLEKRLETALEIELLQAA